MRVPPPGLLKLDRRDLLRDVRERLSERLPQYAEGNDLTDPGWLLMEQAAWMAEILSGRLDQYPFSIVQHFVRMMGGHLRPAQPAVGVVVVEAAIPGTMKQRARKYAPWRFFTSQSETTDLVEFTNIEPEVPICKGWIDSICRIGDGELLLTHHRGGEDGIEAHSGWQDDDGQRSGIFDAEQIQYVLTTANAKKLVGTLEKVIAKIDDRNIGWLKLAIDSETKGQVVLSATVDPSAAFAEAAPDGLWGGGDLQGHWGTLDDTNWTPPVEVSQHPLLPPRVRGSRPLPGLEENTILLPDVPAGVDVGQVLLRSASPMPDTVVDALWKTLAHQDKSLVPFKPTIRRNYAGDSSDEEPAWVIPTLDSGVWNQIVEASHVTVVHAQLHAKSRGQATIRLGLVFEESTADSLPEIRAFGQHADGPIASDPLESKVAWRLTVPPTRDRRRMGVAVAVDVSLDKDTSGVVLVVNGEAGGAMLNPVMVANLPAVRDGRQVRVRRNVPEGVSLLYKDLVTPAVIEQLLAEPIPDDAMEIIRGFPLAYFGLEEGEEIENWRGVDVDPSDGAMTINAPDRDGNLHSLPTGERVKLAWYRRTDGAKANVAPGTIRLVEQEANTKPHLSRVLNPVGAFFGADRETPEAAVDRLFAPSGGTPVLPADFERLVRAALGTRGSGWLVRCWSFAERSLVTSALWPPEGIDKKKDDERVQLARDLERAGPDCLLVAVGPRHEVLSDEDLDWARRSVQQRIRRLGERLPVVRRALVTRLWPLTLRTGAGGEDLHLPSYDLASCRGVLIDPRGREIEPPRAAILLNAAVTSLEIVEEAEE